ncbi:hypothetical protein [Flavobacterium sp. '19STA2R22 D10 B1']|nr:hypothetical protein [Flavobacterium sp. '19STA2R22 D10 B1']
MKNKQDVDNIKKHKKLIDQKKARIKNAEIERKEKLKEIMRKFNEQ